MKCRKRHHFSKKKFTWRTPKRAMKQKGALCCFFFWVFSYIWVIKRRALSSMAAFKFHWNFFTRFLFFSLFKRTFQKNYCSLPLSLSLFLLFLFLSLDLKIDGGARKKGTRQQFRAVQRAKSVGQSAVFLYFYILSDQNAPHYFTHLR